MTTPNEPVITVTREPRRMRYSVSVDGAPAGFTAYGLKGGRYFFVHTEIDDGFEGQGVGSALATAALDDVSARGGRVVPLCPFIAGFIDRHAEYQDLVDDDLMARIDDGRV